MSRNISYNNLATRKRIKEFSGNKLVEENCALYYKRLRKDNCVENQKLFLTECTKSPDMVNKYINTIIRVVNESNNEMFHALYKDEILPILTIKENSIIADEEIIKQIDKNKVCDRIIENNDRIFGSESLDQFIKSCTNDNTDKILYKCCSSVAPFSLPIHGKIMVSLEEFFYIAGKYNIQYEDSKIINGALNYFMIRENFTESDIKKIDISLQNNHVMDYNPSNNSGDFVELFANSFVQNTELLESIMDQAMENEGMLLPNIKKFLRLCTSIILSSKDDILIHDVYSEIIKSLYEKFYTIYLDSENASYLAREIVDILILEKTYVNNMKNAVVEDTVSYSAIIHYTESINEVIDKFCDIANMVYTDYNLSCMKDNVNENSKQFTLQEFKIFKCENLIKVVSNIDKMIANKFSNIQHNMKNKIKKIKRKLFENCNLYDMINYDGTVDFIDSIYEADNITTNIHDIFTDICKEINEFYLKDFGFRSYYIIEGNYILLKFKSDDIICLTEEEKIEQEKYLSEEEIEAFSEVLKFNDIKECKVFEIEDVSGFFSESKENELELFTTFLELASYSGIGKEVIEEIFTDIAHRRNHFKDFYLSTNFLVESYEPLKSDTSIQIEAINTISDMLTITEAVDVNKMKDKAKDVVEGINFSNIKLVLAGIKKKFKDMSAKEQSICRQADNAFNMLVKNTKNALISDRREAIIKGSVIPSFSKCMKIAISLITVGAVTQNPAVPIVALIGGLAASKKLTKKERALLLDDIEVELDMIEREISVAESRNQMKKLRMLLKTKKDLQRQYQRIKYNIRIGKDLIPGSSGVPTRN